ncbi:MAG: flagellar basal body-associated FliL family protein [Catonella sp.]|jgi:flagellar FliL protein|nr:flagellar basal body-associated FliL family protein [Catonella sp.]
MKKNMLTIVAIALSFINVVLTAVIVFSVVPTMQKTNSLITQVASIIDLEVSGSDTGQKTVNIADLDTVAYTNALTINLKSTDGDDANHYAVVDQIILYLDKTAKDYSTIQPSMANFEGKVDEIVTNQLSQYTKDEVNNNREAIKNAILTSIQEQFGTETIVDVSLKNLRSQ